MNAAVRVLVGALVMVLSTSACGATKAMPDVRGKKLDVAKTDIKEAGFDEDPKIDGGGLFGIVRESNWTVCAQSPDPGSEMTDPPRLEVKRSCSTDPAEDPTDAPTGSATPSPSPSDTASTESAEADTLTAANNKDLAALLSVGDGCDERVGEFAQEYAGRRIVFDGSISALSPHGDTKTRLDILVAPGDAGVNSTRGPNFQFFDKNAFDMNLQGSNIPEYFAAGQKFRFDAEVSEYNSGGCLLQLLPVSTRVR